MSLLISNGTQNPVFFSVLENGVFASQFTLAANSQRVYDPTNPDAIVKVFPDDTLRFAIADGKATKGATTIKVKHPPALLVVQMTNRQFKVGPQKDNGDKPFSPGVNWDDKVGSTGIGGGGDWETPSTGYPEPIPPRPRFYPGPGRSVPLSITPRDDWPSTTCTFPPLSADLATGSIVICQVLTTSIK